MIASIGGFDLVFSGQRFGQEGFRYDTMLQRTGSDQEIDLGLTVTPLGAVAKLEHALAAFEDERRSYEGRLKDAERRLASYRSRTGEVFAYADELVAKRQELAEVDNALAEEAILPPRPDLIAA